MARTPLVKEVFLATNGIFSAMAYDFGMQNADLDLLFYTNYGRKTISPIVEHLLGSKTVLSSSDITTLARMILAKYKNKWDREVALMNTEYDPIHNYLDEYSEHKDEIRDEARVEEKNLLTGDTSANSSSNTRTDLLSESVTTTEDSTTTETGHDDRYGFNSNTAVGVTEDGTSTVVDSDGSRTKSNTGTQTHNATENLTRTISETGTDKHDWETDNDFDKEGYHKGNIGNISTQKLINEDLELWRWNIIEEALNDIKDFCTLPLYSMELFE